jgi:beta-glucosidase
MEMPGPAKFFGGLLTDAVKNWKIEEELIDRSLKRILKVLIKLGAMSKKTSIAKINLKNHAKLAREAAENSITLLKNNGSVLPLKKDRIREIGVFGLNASVLSVTGGGSSYVAPYYKKSPLDALKKICGSKIRIDYEPGAGNWEEPPHFDANNPYLKIEKGLIAEYFNNTCLSGKPELTVKTGQTSNHWIFLTPSGINEREFSVRYTGKIKFAYPGNHVLQVNHIGITKIFLDNKLILSDSKSDETGRWNPKKVIIETDSNKEYSIRIEYGSIKEQKIPCLLLRCGFASDAEKDLRIEKAVKIAEKRDIALVFAGMWPGFESEGGDRRNMRLPHNQDMLINAVSGANSNTVVILNCGVPLEMPWLDKVKAVVQVYYPGLEGAEAIAKVLFGLVNPSGKLTVSCPKKYEDNPTYGFGYPGGRKVVYGEGIFVGYRYYEKKGVEVMFPFGHGLSYTKFEYSGLKLPLSVKSGRDFSVSINVKNTGSLSGKEIVQLYVSDKVSRLERPEKELKGFKKIYLKPGETKQISFVLTPRDLSFYDPDMGRWVLEKGEFEILIGSSSKDIRLKGSFKVV